MTSLDQLPEWPEPPADFTLPLSTAPNDVALRVYDYATVAALRARLELAVAELTIATNYCERFEDVERIDLVIAACREPKP